MKKNKPWRFPIPSRFSSSFYDELFNGNTWTLIHGEDFACPIESMIKRITSEGYRRGINVLWFREDKGIAVMKGKP